MTVTTRNGVYDPRAPEQSELLGASTQHVHRPLGDITDRQGSSSSGDIGPRDQGSGDYRSSDSMARPQHRGWQREPHTARDIMSSNVKSVSADTTLREVAQIMKDQDSGIVPVIDEDRRLLGVITDRDLVVRALATNKDPRDVRARDVMSSDIEAVTPDEEIRDVLDLMGDKQVRRVPVVDRDDRLLGIISIGDIATRADNDQELQDAFARISSRRSFWSRLWS